MQVITMNDAQQVSGGISTSTIAAGGRLLGRALLTGITYGSAIGAAIGVSMIIYDVIHTLD